MITHSFIDIPIQQTTYKGSSLMLFKEVDSTNNLAYRYANNTSIDDLLASKNGFVFISEKQTQGKGQFDRTWLSEPGGLYYTLLFKNPYDFKLSKRPYCEGVGKIASYVTYLQTEVSTTFQLPNDIYHGHFKIGGVLIEEKQIHQTPFVIVGIGINLNQQAFPKILKHQATSCFLLKNKQFSKTAFIKQLTDHLIEAFNKDSW